MVIMAFMMTIFAFIIAIMAFMMSIMVFMMGILISKLPILKPLLAIVRGKMPVFTPMMAAPAFMSLIIKPNTFHNRLKPGSLIINYVYDAFLHVRFQIQDGHL